MTQTTSVWLVLGLAFLAANLPFLNERLLAVWPRAGDKSLWLRLLELAILYVLVGGIGLALEQHAGQIAPQGWEFYAITAALFLTFAFPGFVYRYLAQRR
ncbi:MAG: DUF2818 family protein [Serpentinimonas sp.]|jgi:hypothetical protein|nr:DUF2818 family protein [Serpentinimonas sp.]